MKPLAKTEPMRPGTPSLIILGVGILQAQVLCLGRMDRRYEGTLEGGGRCVWLKDGRRVEFEPVPGGGFLAAVGLEPDPAWPGREVADGGQ